LKEAAPVSPAADQALPVKEVAPAPIPPSQPKEEERPQLKEAQDQAGTVAAPAPQACADHNCRGEAAPVPPAAAQTQPVKEAAASSMPLAQAPPAPAPEPPQQEVAAAAATATDAPPTQSAVALRATRPGAKRLPKLAGHMAMSPRLQAGAGAPALDPTSARSTGSTAIAGDVARKDSAAVPKKGLADSTKAGDWDTDEENGAAGKEKQNATNEVPVSGQVVNAEACDWDSEHEEHSRIPTKGHVLDAEACDWDSDVEDKPKEGSAARKQQSSPAAPEERSDCNKVNEVKKEACAMTSDMTDDSDAKKGLAMTFDMGGGKPKRAVPKHLAARLSRPSTGKRRKESKKGAGSEVQTPEVPAVDKVPSSQANGALPPPKVAACHRARLAAAAAAREDERAKMASEREAAQDVACGAPPRPSAAYVAAESTPEMPVPAPVPPAFAGDSLAGDLLAEVLTKDDAPALAPFKGSGSHGFVPRFHCVGCDMQVLRVENHVWSDEVAYMFLRNNYPNVMRLRTQLRPQQGSCAYCCQCSSRAADKSVALETVADGLRWRVLAE